MEIKTIIVYVAISIILSIDVMFCIYVLAEINGIKDSILLSSDEVNKSLEAVKTFSIALIVLTTVSMVLLIVYFIFNLVKKH